MKENNIAEGFWVFVSHSTKDFERVRLVRNALENSGSRPILFYLKCMEDEGIESGAEFEGVIIQAIYECEVVLFMQSGNSLKSPWTKRGVNYAESE